MRTLFFVFVVCVFFVPSAFADMTVRITQQSGYYYGGGGEFTHEVTGDPITYGTITIPTGTKYQSFCVEDSEFINPGSEYDVIVNTGAIMGNGGGDGSFDPLDPRTAFLFTHFSNQTLTGYNYTPGSGRVASARALQRVIWGLEGELGTAWTPAAGLETDFWNLAYEATEIADTWLEDPNPTGYTTDGIVTWSGIGNVRILNLYVKGYAGNPDYLRQDQLVVPAPAAVLLGLLGLSVAGVKLRKYA